MTPKNPRMRPLGTVKRAGCGCVTLALLLAVVVVINSRDPSLDIRDPVMPHPNARDLLVSAAGLRKNDLAPPPRGRVFSVSQQVAPANADAPAIAEVHKAFKYPYAVTAILWRA